MGRPAARRKHRRPAPRWTWADRYLDKWVKGRYPHNTPMADLLAGMVVLGLTIRDWWHGGGRPRHR